MGVDIIPKKDFFLNKVKSGRPSGTVRKSVGRPFKPFLYRSRKLSISVSNQVYYTLKKHDISISLSFDMLMRAYLKENGIDLVTEDELKEELGDIDKF